MTALPDLDSRLDAISTALAEQFFREFFRQAWQVIEPSTPFVPNWHIDAECDHAQAVSEGRIQNLIVNQPPRTLKSTIWSVAWPAWEWISKPSTRWVFSSYASALAVRDSVACRRLIESAWYQKRWGNRFRLSSDQNVKSHFENDRGGRRFSTSVDSGTTGWGGSRVVCLAPGSTLETNHGNLRIEDIVELEIPVLVKSFDHKSGAAELQGIEAFESSAGRPSITVTCSDGSKLTTTEDHLYFSLDRGYLDAAQLVVGERLLSSGMYAVSGTDQEEDRSSLSDDESERPVLFSQMRHNLSLEKERYRGTLGSNLLQLRQGVLSGSIESGATEEVVLQRCLRDGWRDRTRKSSLQGRIGEGQLRHMRERSKSKAICCSRKTDILFPRVSSLKSQRKEIESSVVRAPMCGLRCAGERAESQSDRQGSSLLSSVREYNAQQADVWQWEYQIHPWKLAGGLSSRVLCNGPEDPQAGRISLSVVLENRAKEGTRRSPHRLRQEEQFRGKPDNALQVLPRVNARRGEKPEAPYEVTVVSIERAATPARVYNVKIRKNHNYFANGILVHNCDDPNGASEGDAVRKHTNDWWDQTMSSRLDDKRTGARVVIQQRIHEDDLTGHLISRGGWDHLCIPMEFEGKRRPTVIGWTDPRTKRGELLYSGENPRIGPIQIADLKRDLGAYAYAGQYQQRPSPAEGGILKRYWFRYWNYPGQPLPPITVRNAKGEYQDIASVPLPALDEEALSFDCAFKGMDTSDFIAGGHWGRRGADKFLLNQKCDRMTFTETLACVENMAAGAPRATLKLIEDKANGPAVIDTLRSRIAGIVAVNPQGGKMARAQAISPQVEAGNVFLPHPLIAPWVDAFLDECAAFPNASHDDQVDQMSQMLLRWQTHSGIFHTSEQSVICQPITIPQTWKRGAAMVIRGDKVSAVWAATDPASGTMYLTMEYVRSGVDPMVHASVLAMQRWIPFTVSVPDLGKEDERKVAQRYRMLGVKTMDAPGEPETFLQELTQAMGQSRFKVFSQLAQWTEQFRLAGNQQDKAIEVTGDLIAATCLLFGARERMVVGSGNQGQRSDGMPRVPGAGSGIGITWA
ncbi:MAG: phage terminase large subunit [Acidobacteriota bacterium]